ncbi:MAG: HD domain-containing protein [Treponema sp.]|jgi:HD-GYP domain-containing protein (c-di-GMP phosphodiesterase class II)|nr:HD domain-containing protein [Treponema sp.]
MEQYLVKDILVGSRFSKNIFLDGQFILATPEIAFSQELKDTLILWNYKVIYSAGELISPPPVEPAPVPASDPQSKLAPATASRPGMSPEDEKTKQAEKFYETFVEYLRPIFELARAGNGVNFQSLATKVQEACVFVHEDRHLLHRLQKAFTSEEDYLASHGVRCMLISLLIGHYLKLPDSRLVELGVAALMHEIGLSKISQSVYLNENPTPAEWKSLHLHPLVGYNILKKSNFPLSVSLVALEHHERENGSGYPQKLVSEKISLYSKIVAVACSYETLSAKRPNSHSHDGHTSALEVLKNQDKRYNETVVKALLYALSLYPVGLYVLLSNKKKGQVIDVNPENPRFPIVELLGEFTPDGKSITVQTSSAGVSISGPLPKEEVGF